MDKTKSILIPVADSTQVGEARRIASVLAEELGFDAQQGGAVGIVVTEAAGNLIRHAGGGEIVLRRLTDGSARGLDILALDRGPGMADVRRCLRDGHSTAGTAGNGLGAIARLSQEFDIHSLPGVGTAILSRLWADASRPPKPAPGPEIGVVCLPVQREEECGDAWAARRTLDRTRLLLADGLGHGPFAAEASGAAVGVVEESSSLDLPTVLKSMHDALRHTRGAALALADVTPDEIRFVGVGNIAGAIVSDGGTRSMVSHNGTVGHQLLKVQEFSYPWPPDALIVLHSDGLGSQWRLDRYPGLVTRHPSLIAGVLYRDFCRGRDDVTVLVLRHGEEARP